MEAVTDHLPGAVKVPAIHNDGDRRDLRLDACRGLALSFIFIDHISGNSLACRMKSSESCCHTRTG